MLSSSQLKKSNEKENVIYYPARSILVSRLTITPNEKENMIIQPDVYMNIIINVVINLMITTVSQFLLQSCQRHFLLHIILFNFFLSYRFVLHLKFRVSLIAILCKMFNFSLCRKEYFSSALHLFATKQNDQRTLFK
jgi:hypothetical protein